jgi:hypothetical protein
MSVQAIPQSLIEGMIPSLTGTVLSNELGDTA